MSAHDPLKFLNPLPSLILPSGVLQVPPPSPLHLTLFLAVAKTSWKFTLANPSMHIVVRYNYILVDCQSLEFIKVNSWRCKKLRLPLKVINKVRDSLTTPGHQGFKASTNKPWSLGLQLVYSFSQFFKFFSKNSTNFDVDFIKLLYLPSQLFRFVETECCRR